MALSKNGLLSERIEELSVKLLIIKEKMATLVDEQRSLERELGNLIAARERLVNHTEDDSTAMHNRKNRITEIANGVLTTRRAAREGVRHGSIKEAALRVLSDHPEGLLALDVLRLINAERERPIPRTSLSPQLSRLGQNGLASQHDSVWKITEQGEAVLSALSEH